MIERIESLLSGFIDWFMDKWLWIVIGGVIVIILVFFNWLFG